MSGPRLPIPAEFAGVPQRALRDFLVQYSRLICDQFAPGVTEGRVRAFVNEVLSDAATGQARPADLALEFKHVCRFSGCNLDDCQLCRNNPSKVCEPTTVFDRQYWVRDDGKGGQVIKARCGAEVGMQLLDRSTGQPVVLPDVSVKLYVVNGQTTGPPGVGDLAGGLYLADDGHPLYSAGGSVPDDDGGITLEMVQDDVLGAVGRLPEFQFLDKNSKFKSGGRTYKSFKLLARALRTDAVTGRQSVLAQVESDSFKVTTKKGYDGCRKAEYLFAHQPITDKTFATLGETTICNLKTTFEGVETVEDLMRLVQASASAPELQSRLRDTLNMARDTDKWRKLTRMLSERVVWDDSIQRLFVVPTGTRPLGLLFRANKGQADFDAPLGLVYQPPLPTGQVRGVRINDRSLVGCGRYVDALKQLAATYWSFTRHPGWALVPDQPKWEHANASAVTEVFMEVLGQGDPVAAAEAHLLQLASTLQAPAPAAAAAGGGGGPTGSAGFSQPSPVRSPSPLSVDNHAAAVAAVMAAAGSNGLLSGAGLGAAAAAGVAPLGGSWHPMGLQGSSGSSMALGSGAFKSGSLPGVLGGGSGGIISPFEGANAMAGVASGAMQAGNSAAGTLESLLASAQMGGSGGFNPPSGLVLPTNTSSGMMLVSPAGQAPSVEASAFALPATSMHMSGRSTSGMTENTSDTSHSTPQVQQMQASLHALLQQQHLQQQQQQPPQGMLQQQSQPVMQQQQQTMQPPPRNAKSLALGSLPMGSMLQQGPNRTVSGPAFGPGPSGLGQNQAVAVQAGGLSMVGAVSAGPTVLGQLDGLTAQGLGPGQGLGPQIPSAAGGGGAGGVARHAQGPFATMQQLPPDSTLQQLQGQVQGVSKQQSLSNNTLLLQQAIVEGWPAPQMKALLDQMSDEELQQLVQLHAASEAAVGSAAGGGPVPGALPGAAGAAAGPSSAFLQGFGSSIAMPSSGASGSGKGLMIATGATQAAARQQQPVVQQQQQQQGQQSPLLQPGAAAGAAGTGTLPVQQRQQQQGMLPPKSVQPQQRQAAAGGGVGPQPPPSSAADAALMALFADAGDGGPDVPREMSDVQLAGDQGGLLPGALLGLDSFTGDIAQWGDLLNDLRHISSGSGNPPGGSGLPNVNSLSTDWIPELLSKRSALSGANAAAAAAAAGDGAAGALPAGDAAAAAAGGRPSGGNNQVGNTGGTQAGGDAGVPVGSPEAAGAVVGLGDRAGRRGKRERSKTGQGPSAAQKQEWQALFGVDEDSTELRSVSKAEAHFDSFNRHFPVARLTSKTNEIKQGAQVAYPWAPGQRLSQTGVAHPPAVQPISPDSPNPFVAQQTSGSPMVASPMIRQTSSPLRSRPPVTTDSPQVVQDVTRTISGTLDGVTAGPTQQAGLAGPTGPTAVAAAGPDPGTAAGGGGWRSVTPPLTAPTTQTEEGAAAVESLTGLRAGWCDGLGCPDGSQPSASGLRGILELCGDATPASDSFMGAGGVNMLLASGQRSDCDAAAVVAAAAMDNPFALAAREPMPPPAPQAREQLVHRDSLGRQGWIAGLFRRSGSWSSGVNGSGGSGSGPSGGSHTSKEGGAGLIQTGSVRGPAAGGA